LKGLSRDSRSRPSAPATEAQPHTLVEIAATAARLVDPILKRSRAEGPRGAVVAGRDIKLAEDRACERAIRAFLVANSPFAVLGEEEGWGGAEADDGPHWVIDPLDGSFNFFRGVPLYAVSIALCRGEAGTGETRLGVIYDPVRDELISGGEGLPVLLNGAPTGADRTMGARQMLATGYPARADPAEVNARLGKFTQEWTKIRMLGSAALSLGWVALGRLDGYAEQGIMWWDVAAGLAIARAAGAKTEVLSRGGYAVDVIVAA
jgi:myo-inositol-1(or 4)-monophosphatase